MTAKSVGKTAKIKTVEKLQKTKTAEPEKEPV
jgi:hypothetical protein